MATTCFEDLPPIGGAANFQTWPRAQTIRTSSFFRRNYEQVGAAAPAQFLGTPRNNTTLEWEDGIVSQGWFKDEVLYYTTSHHRPVNNPFTDPRIVVHHVFAPIQTGEPFPPLAEQWNFTSWLFWPPTGWHEQRCFNGVAQTYWRIRDVWNSNFGTSPIANSNRSCYQGVPNFPTWVRTNTPVAGPPGLPWPPEWDESFWP